MAAHEFQSLDGLTEVSLIDVADGIFSSKALEEDPSWVVDYHYGAWRKCSPAFMEAQALLGETIGEQMKMAEIAAAGMLLEIEGQLPAQRDGDCAYQHNQDGRLTYLAIEVIEPTARAAIDGLKQAILEYVGKSGGDSVWWRFGPMRVRLDCGVHFSTAEVRWSARTRLVAGMAAWCEERRELET